MKPTKTLAYETRPVEVQVWPRTFLVDLKKQLFGDDVWVEGQALYSYTPYDTKHLVKELTQTEMEVYDAMSRLIAGITKLEQEG